MSETPEIKGTDDENSSANIQQVRESGQTWKNFNKRELVFKNAYPAIFKPRINKIRFNALLERMNIFRSEDRNVKSSRIASVTVKIIKPENGSQCEAPQTSKKADRQETEDSKTTVEDEYNDLFEVLERSKSNIEDGFDNFKVDARQPSDLEMYENFDRDLALKVKREEPNVATNTLKRKFEEEEETVKISKHKTEDVQDLSDLPESQSNENEISGDSFETGEIIDDSEVEELLKSPIASPEKTVIVIEDSDHSKNTLLEIEEILDSSEDEESLADTIILIEDSDHSENSPLEDGEIPVSSADQNSNKATENAITQVKDSDHSKKLLLDYGEIPDSSVDHSKTLIEATSEQHTGALPEGLEVSKFQKNELSKIPKKRNLLEDLELSEISEGDLSIGQDAIPKFFKREFKDADFENFLNKLDETAVKKDFESSPGALDILSSTIIEDVKPFKLIETPYEETITKNPLFMIEFLNVCSQFKDWKVEHFNKPFQLTCVNKNDWEYAYVNYYACPRMEITKLERIDNPYLYAQFCLLKEYKTHLLGKLDIRKLFHGTKREFLNSICTHNLDWRKIGCNGQLGNRYGNGVSFAQETSYALQFPRRCGDRTRIMLLCDVLVHRECPGTSDMIVPKEPFDTTVSPENDVLVKYIDNEFLPKYVIHYKLHY